MRTLLYHSSVVAFAPRSWDLVPSPAFCHDWRCGGHCTTAEQTGACECVGRRFSTAKAACLHSGQAMSGSANGDIYPAGTEDGEGLKVVFIAGNGERGWHFIYPYVWMLTTTPCVCHPNYDYSVRSLWLYNASGIHVNFIK